jgi:glycosyltransferase involved in cell wall biosynthesis
MPCLNEAETIAQCIIKAKKAIEANHLVAEILIADNGSSDGSQNIASNLGARVIYVNEKGYGNVLRFGIQSANGKYIIMGDADDSYDFGEIMPFVNKLREGYDLVMGNRFTGGIEKGAMPFLHKYLGNPFLSFIGRLFFKIRIGDFHSGLRGFNKESIEKMDLKTTGMEFASEMVVKSAIHNYKITEVPTKLYRDGRSRPPHLRTWRDGWRHLRFLLMYSPKWLFFYPGITLVITGVLITSILFNGPVFIGNVGFDVHTMLYSSTFVIIGIQMIAFYLFSRTYAINEGLDPDINWLKNYNRYFSLEKGIILGFILFTVGLGITIESLYTWNKLSYGNLNPSQMLRKVIPAVTLLVLGTQIIFYSFFNSLLNLKKQ